MVPQLDVSFYSSQIFWVIVCLLILVVMLKRFIKKIENSIENRNDYISKLGCEIKNLKEKEDELSNEYNGIIEQRNNYRNKLIDDVKQKCEVEFRSEFEKLRLNHEKEITKIRKQGENALNELKNSLNTEDVTNDLFIRLLQGERK